MIVGLTFADWGVIAALVLAAPVAIALVWAIIRGTRHLTLVHEAIVGRPETAWDDGKPSMVARFQVVNEHLEKQDGELAYVRGELSYNGGNSTKDQVRKTDLKVALLMSGQAAVIVREGAIADTAIATADALHTETADTAADVATTAVKVAEAMETKRLAKPAPNKAAPRKRVAKKVP